jgi:hypothetical protein
MTTKRTPKWKKFENLVADIQKSISPDSRITTNERIIGKRTGHRREVDIVIRQPIGQFELLIVMDCKDYHRPVDVKDVEAFLGLVEDVGANKGAIVAAAGFTQTAKRRAQDSGIELFRLVDVENHDWKSYVAIPVVCDFRSIESWRCKFKAEDTTKFWIVHHFPLTIPLYRSDYSFSGSVQSLLWEMWNNRRVSHEPGFYSDICPSESPSYVKIASDNFRPIEILFDFVVQKKLYFGYLPLTKIKGLSDELERGIILPKVAEIETDWIDSSEVEHKWQLIPSLDTLAVKPFFILEALDRYPVEDPFKL